MLLWIVNAAATRCQHCTAFDCPAALLLLLLLPWQVLRVVAAAVGGVLAGQKKQDKLKGRINHEFNKVGSRCRDAVCDSA
jgi:hypothetical protein